MKSSRQNEDASNDMSQKMKSSHRNEDASNDMSQNQVVSSASDMKAAFDRLFNPEDQEGAKLLHEIYAQEDSSKARSPSPKRVTREFHSLTPPRHFVRGWIRIADVSKLSKG